MNPSHSTPTEAREAFTPTTFTPGPWSAAKATDSLDLPVYEIHGDESRMKLCTWVATVHETQVDPKVAEANARLIASAPELLAALKAAKLMLDSFLSCEMMSSVDRARYEAIERALQTSNA